MSNLRPPRVETLAQQPDADDRAKTQTASTTRPLPLLAIAAIGLAGVIALGSVIAAGVAPPATPPTPVAEAPTLPPEPSATPQPTDIPTTPTPSCASAADWINTVDYYAKRAEWAIAAKNADAALSQPHTCAEDRTTLANLLVTYGVKSLLAEKFVPQDTAAQLASVDRYRGLKRRAADLDVAFPTSLQVATEAYAIGQFPLAKAAFEDAFVEGAFTLADQTLLQNYSSTLYNIGIWWTNGDPDSQTYALGLRMLVASYRIDQTYGTGLGEAEAKLKELAGRDPETWPDPIDTPLPLSQK